MPLAVGSSLGPYQILARIGAGGMGEVYEARDTRLKRNVAIKVLPESVAKNPQRRARFQHEAEVLAALNHPNIAAIYGIEESTSTALVMELVEGVSLADKIRSRRLRLTETLDLATQIANGLGAAHKSGVVHRDLKPSNVMVTPTGVVKLVDFGLAKLREPAARGDEETETIAEDLKTEEGQILGTVAYMSPEQAQGRPVDGRSDIFSFGVLLYEVFTGCMPFQGESKVATLAAILQRDPRPFAGTGVDLPREAERIVLRCLRKDPDRRFQTVADLRISLEDLREDLSTGQLGLTPSVAPRRPHWRLAVGAIVVLGLCGAVAALLVSRNRPRASHPLTQITFEASIARDPALSPDGKLLAYASDRGSESQFEIWLKQLAGGEPLRLTSGVGSKYNPQFSSDGTKVYYLSRGDLLEVPSLGGVARKVLDHVGPFTRSSRDEIAFYRPGTGTSPGPITIVPADGGTPETWHPECLSLGRPVWSPEGDRLAFEGECANSGARGIMVGSRQGGSVQRVSPVPFEQRDSWLVWFRLRNGREGLLFSAQSGDSTNIFRVSLDGTRQRVTSGAGFETAAAASPAGDVIFTNAESSTTIRSMSLGESSARSIQEAAPATLFAASKDGTKLIYGRMLGTVHGELVLHDRNTRNETILAAHDVVLSGVGSFWPQISPDGKRVIYRIITDPHGSPRTTPPSADAFSRIAVGAIYMIPTEGGAPRVLVPGLDRGFALVSDWRPDGERVIGECGLVSGGICELDPRTKNPHLLLSDPQGGQLLYPSFSWDGKWVVFMLRRGGRTGIVVTPVRQDGSLAGEAQWVRISTEGVNSSRPRFAPDGSSIYYLNVGDLFGGGGESVIRQKLDPISKKPAGEPMPLASARFSGPGVSLIAVSRDRIFFNTSEVHSNVWRTPIE